MMIVILEMMNQNFSLELSDLVRSLTPSLGLCIFLRLKVEGRRFFSSYTTFYWFRNRDKDCVQYFSQEDALVYCNDILDAQNNSTLTTRFLNGDCSLIYRKGVLRQFCTMEVSMLLYQWDILFI